MRQYSSTYQEEKDRSEQEKEGEEESPHQER